MFMNSVYMTFKAWFCLKEPEYFYNYRIYSRISRSAYKSNYVFGAKKMPKIIDPGISRIEINWPKVSLFLEILNNPERSLYKKIKFKVGVIKNQINNL